MTGMFIAYLLHAYASWLFASVMFIWLGSVLYRTTRNTLNASYAETEGAGNPVPQVIQLPARPVREPSVHLATAA
jgi:hypothetical protein